MKNDSTPKGTLALLGVKQPESPIHEYGRTVVMIILIGIIAWSIYSEEEETAELEDFKDIIKEDSLLYRQIAELDDEHQRKYLCMLKHAFETEQEHMYHKYSKSIGLALIGALCSEYIVSGSTSKSIGGMAKTVLSTAWSTLVS